VAILDADHTSINIGEIINFDGGDSYGDAAIDGYLFDMGDGTQSGWITKSIYSYEYEDADTYTATLVVKDIYGQESEEVEIEIEVLEIGQKPNKQPTAEITLITPDPAEVGESIFFSGEAQDKDGRITGYEWRSSIDGYLSSDRTFYSSKLSEGIHKITFHAQDDDDDWSDTDEVTLQVSTQLTTVSIEVRSPDSGLILSPGGYFTLKGTATSDRTPLDRIEVQIDGGKWMLADGTTSWSFEVSTAGLIAGANTIAARAVAGSHTSAPVSMTFSIKGDDITPTSADDDEGFSILSYAVDNPLMVLGALALICVIGITLFFATDARNYRRNKKKEEEIYYLDEEEDIEDL